MNPFERLARVLTSRRSGGVVGVFPGPPDGVDCRQGDDWRRHATAAALFFVWGPPQTSPWSAYHRPTLFAALDSLRAEDVRPRAVQGLDARDAPRRGPAWADERTAVVLDLPGEASVAYAAWLARTQGHETVVTFNNWPHAKEVVPVTPVLGALLHFAPWVAEPRPRRDLRAIPPPVLALDARRLGGWIPKPNTFDNRYYLLEADLPTAPTLRRHGVERVVYVTAEAQERDDVNRYLHELTRHARLETATASLDGWRIDEPRPYAPALRKTPFNTSTDPAFRGFRRAAAGGFGRLVPEPSGGGG